MNPFRIARALYKKSDHPNFKHVAIVVRGGAVVSVGYNHNSIHAEVNALNHMWPSERRGTRVWSMRITRGGRFRMARPCADCMRYLRESGVKMVYYTDSAGDIQSEAP